MKVKITPARVCGKIKAPPSKSYAHRAVICAALANGKSVIKGISPSEDISATLDCISALGARYSLGGDTLTVTGIGGKIPKNAVGGDCKREFADGKKRNGAEKTEAGEKRVFPCRESGSTLRFFIPLSLVFGKNAVFTGAPRLMERGIGIYEALFSEKGIECKNDGKNITLSGSLPSGEYVLSGNVSSQFVSGLMFALPLLDGDSVIKVLPPVESRGYIDITLEVLKKSGIEISETEKNTFFVRGGQHYSCLDTEVEGDWSNGAALIALCDLVSEKERTESGNTLSDAYALESVREGTLRYGNTEVCGLRQDSIQGDRVCTVLFEELKKQGLTADISGCPDLGPVLFAFAAAKGGGAFVGTRRLRIKESDRAAASAEELGRFGISVTVGENTVTVHKGTLKAPSVPCQSHNDHRMVMALTVLGALVGCEIEGAEAITKSYPGFFDAIASLGIKVEKEDGI